MKRKQEEEFSNLELDKESEEKVRESLYCLGDVIFDKFQEQKNAIEKELELEKENLQKEKKYSQVNHKLNRFKIQY